jgi:acyl carrier protein
MHDTRPYDSFEQLGLDSLDYVELIMFVEETYDVEFVDEAVDDIKTIGGLHGLLIRTLESQREAEVTHRDTEHTRGSAISKARNLPYHRGNPQAFQNPGRCTHCGRSG